MLYGTTHLLSIWRRPLQTKRLFSGLLYTAKPIELTVVAGWYGLGKCLEHLLFFMHGHLGLV